jgi:hypothetical protein
MQSTKRPLGVWIILVLYSVSVFSSMRSLWPIYTRRLPASGSGAEYLQNPGALNLALVVIGLMLTVAFLVSLFRMRRVAITIFTTSIVLAVFSNLWYILFENHPSLFTASFLVPVVVSLALLGVIYLYLRALVRVGHLT